MSAWRDALAQYPALWDLAAWPQIDQKRLPSDARKTFLRNKRIVALVLSGQKLKQVARTLRCSPGTITQLMNRCFQPVEDHYALTTALLRYQHLTLAERRCPLPTFTDECGTRSAMSGLFRELPALKSTLDEMILKRIKDDPRAGPISAHKLHGQFKRVLAEAHWPTDRYPYTTQSLAYESVRRYAHQRHLEYQEARAQKTAPTFSSCASRVLHHARVFDRIQLDAQQIDFKGRLNLVLNDQLIPLRVASAWLYLAIDVATDCVLGYTLCYKTQPDRWDVLRLLAQCVEPWEPLSLSTPGLAYLPGSYLPSGLPERPVITFNMVQLDNAWTNHARMVESVLVDHYAATLHLGRPATPKQRHWVEHAFDNLNRALSHQLPSTRGSFVRDPKRESRTNQKNPPIFTWRMFEEALDVVLTQHNALPQGGRLGAASPLDLLRYQLTQHWSPFTPTLLREQRSLYEVREVLTVKSRRDGYARHLNLDNVHYPCMTLQGLSAQVRSVEVRYDWRDLRELSVFTLDGRSLGVVYAPKSWQSYPHSKATRRFINRLIKAERLASPNLLAGTLYWLASHNNQPTQAMHLLRLYSEFSAGTALFLEPPGAPEEIPNATTGTAPPGSYRWSSKEAYHAP